MKTTKDIKIRNIKVYELHTQRLYSKPYLVPQIRFCGKWLREAGFETGDHIKIITTNKCLVIVPDEKKQEDL